MQPRDHTPHARARLRRRQVRIHERESGSLEVRFGPGFDDADLDTVKAIAGRRYDAERQTWLLPGDDGRVLERLIRHRHCRAPGECRVDGE